MSDEPKHTLGPWVVFVDRGSDAMIFSVLPAGRAGEIAGNIDNGPDADLIAAAPDMLEALNNIAAGNLGVTDAMLESREAMMAALARYCQETARIAVAKITEAGDLKRHTISGSDAADDDDMPSDLSDGLPHHNR